MSIDNKRRKAKSLPQYKTLEEYRKSEEKDEDEEKKAEANPPESEIDVDGDALLLETGSILVDVIRLSTKPAEQQASSF